jgi:hypothetical protein
MEDEIRHRLIVEQNNPQLHVSSLAHQTSITAPLRRSVSSSDLDPSHDFTGVGVDQTQDQSQTLAIDMAALGTLDSVGQSANMYGQWKFSRNAENCIPNLSFASATTSTAVAAAATTTTTTTTTMTNATQISNNLHHAKNKGQIDGFHDKVKSFLQDDLENIEPLEQSQHTFHSYGKGKGPQFECTSSSLLPSMSRSANPSQQQLVQQRVTRNAHSQVAVLHNLTHLMVDYCDNISDAAIRKLAWATFHSNITNSSHKHYSADHVHSQTHSHKSTVEGRDREWCAFRLQVLSAKLCPHSMQDRQHHRSIEVECADLA